MIGLCAISVFSGGAGQKVEPTIKLRRHVWLLCKTKYNWKNATVILRRGSAEVATAPPWSALKEPRLYDTTCADHL